MVRRTAGIVLLLVSCCAPRVSPSVQPSNELAPPRAHQVAWVERLWGHEIKDPYRWMEQDTTALLPWLKEQNDSARRALSSIPSRAAFFDRFKALNAPFDVSHDARYAGERVFFLLRRAEADSEGLAVRERSGIQRMVFECDSHSQIDYFEPSGDGQLVAIGTSRDGSEDSTLQIVAIDGDREYAEKIEHTRFAKVSWAPTNDAFVYGRYLDAPTAENAPLGHLSRRVFLHHIGRPTSDDTIVFGPEVTGLPKLDPGDAIYVTLEPRSPHAIAVRQQGTGSQSLYVKEFRDLANPKISWREIAALDRQVDTFVFRGDDVFALSYQNSSNGRVDRIPLSPNMSPSVFIPEPSDPISSIAATSTALLVVRSRDGRSHLWRHPFDGTSASEASLPSAGFVQAISAAPSHPRALLQIEEWTSPPRWWSIDTNAGDPQRLPLEPHPFSAFRDIEVEEVEARSADGTMVPLTVMYKRPLKRDGDRPTLLTAYGAYGVSLDASFRPNRLAWLERGGILSIAHVRGGGERGENWHRAGMRGQKLNSIADFIACAEHLIRYRYTSHGHIAAFGESAGGLVVGNAMVRRPDLFAAVLITSTMNNALRIEATSSGPANTTEFGSIATEDGFRDLLSIDTYQGVREDVAYPPLLLSVGMNDARVPPWQSSKLAARLQSFGNTQRPVLLRVDFDGGHGTLPVIAQAALAADMMAFALSWTQFGERSAP
jgi:prolyl oligopeptidase